MNEYITMSGELKSAEDLSNYIHSVGQWLEATISALGWTKEEIVQAEAKVVCPVDSNHRMPVSALQKHLKYCALRKEGYSGKQIDDASVQSYFYEKSKAVVPVKLDIPTVQTVCRSAPGCSAALPENLPLTVERYTREFTHEQRLKIYEHVVQVAKSTQQQDELSEEQYSFLTQDLVKKHKKAQQEKPKSHVELLAMKRDMKRRRQSYKGKSYTAKKSQKQIIADVIHNQTEILRELWIKEQEESRDVNKHSDHSQRERSRSRSRNRSDDIRVSEAATLDNKHADGANIESKPDIKEESHQHRKRSRSRTRSLSAKKKKSKKHHDREHRKHKKHKKHDKD